MNAIIVFNSIISLLFTVCYAYQVFYVIVGLISRPRRFVAKKDHRYAVVISARNERDVIRQLIQSIKDQKYPSQLVDTFVIADNCTDDTAKVARKEGAIVYERFDTTLIGKGYALDWFFETLNSENKYGEYDGFFVIDADNVLDPYFIYQMNKVFNNGYKIVTSYRNSKNYGQNWITAGYSLWFLREAKYLNNSRMRLGTSCAISGTGFLVSSDIIKQNGGWIHHLLTEDIEFTADAILHGEKIGYCPKAVLYDEQPATFQQSYIQRMRWAKGFYQVFNKYGKDLIRGFFKGCFSCYDMLMTLMPAMLLTLVSVVVNVIAIPIGAINNLSEIVDVFKFLGQTFYGFYSVFFAMGLITTVTEWKKIYCSGIKKIIYMFTFPIFMATYVPISIIAIFRKVEWQPIKHTVAKSVEDICKEDTVLKK